MRSLLLVCILLAVCSGAFAQTSGTVVIWNNVNSEYVTHTTGTISYSFPTIGTDSDATGPIALGKPVFVEEVRVHLNAAGGAGDLTLTLNHRTIAGLDIVMVTLDMTTATDIHWIPSQDIYLANGDTLDIAWANASNRTYAVEFVWRRL